MSTEQIQCHRKPHAIVTRAFEHQESPLTLEDFQALWACLREFKALGFYNSGPGAGASQPHKHLQLVPLPRTEEISLPIAVLFPAEANAGALHIDRLPFAHTFVRLSREHATDPLAAASYAYDMCRAMLASAGRLHTVRCQTRCPRTNLLPTDEFMLLIRRSRASFRYRRQCPWLCWSFLCPTR